jgi:hypothetical protein
MNAVSFLCVSVGSSTIHLHDILGWRRACACSEAGLSSQIGDGVLRVYYQRETFCYTFLWVKGLSAKPIHKKMFVYSGKCLSRKAVHNCVENSLKDVRKSQTMPDQERKWLRQQSKDFCAAGFDALVKRWDKCVNVGEGYVEK